MDKGKGRGGEGDENICTHRAVHKGAVRRLADLDAVRRDERLLRQGP